MKRHRIKYRLLSLFTVLFIVLVLTLDGAVSALGENAVDSENDSYRITAFEDTYVQNGFSDKNFGGEKQIIIKGNTAGATHRIAYLKFDLSGVAAADVGKAEIVLSGTAGSAEDTDNPQDYIFYEVDANSWSEMAVTYNTRPTLGNEVTRRNALWGTRMSFDLTDYVKNHVGKKISLALTGDPNTGTRVDFNSRESGSGPILMISKSLSNYQVNLPKKEGFGQGQDPWEWAEKLYAESKYEKTEPYETGNVKKTAAMIYKMTVSEDTYANSGKAADTNFGNSEKLMIKSDAATTDTGRRTFLKFKLNELPEGDILYSYLYLYTVYMQNDNVYPVEIYLADSNSWTQNTLTWNNMPSAAGEPIASESVYQNGTWYKFDISETVNEAKAEGQNELSLVVVDTNNRRVDFGSSRSSSAPYVEMCINDGSRGEITPSPGNDPSQYTKTAAYFKRSNREKEIPAATRTLETLPGYTMTAEKPKLGQYGGRLDRQYKATGFYRSEKINGRWWIIDPEGHPMMNMGVAVTVPNYGGSQRLWNLMLSKFGSETGWANKTVEYLKNKLYFNGAGAWSSSKLLDASQPFGYTEVVYFLQEYMKSIGIGFIPNGSSTFVNGGLNVFDPDFPVFCDGYAAKNVAKRKDKPRFMAWMADNELECTHTMLDSFLQADWSDPINTYTYAAAWTFLKHYTGKDNPSVDDVTELAREDFLDFVWDRYHNVVSTAIRKYDPNHMYWGSRAVFDAQVSPGFLAGAGRYTDGVCCNYYEAWTPERDTTTRWNVWSYDTPYLVSEFYAMGEDADPQLKNSGGAGFIVPTQEDRALFYQNFALKLMESKNCMGFHWFTYMDNDPTVEGSDSSNVDSNKGLMNTFTYEPYTELTAKMEELNRQAYSVIDYFDEQTENTVEIMPYQDFETNYDANQWDNNAAGTKLPVADGKLGDVRNEGGFSCGDWAYPVGFNAKLTDGTVKKIVILANDELKSRTEYGCYSEISLVDSAANNGDSPIQKLFAVQNRDGDKDGRLRSYSTGNEDITETSRIETIPFKGDLAVVIDVDAGGKTGQATYYQNGSRLLTTAQISNKLIPPQTVKLEGTTHIRLSLHNNSTGYFDNVEAFALTTDNLNLQYRGVTAEDGSEIPKDGICRYDSFALNFDSPILSCNLENAIKINGEVVSMDRISLSENRRSIIVAPPKGFYAANTDTIKVTLEPNCIKSCTEAPYGSGITERLTINHSIGVVRTEIIPYQDFAKDADLNTLLASPVWDKASNSGTGDVLEAKDGVLSVKRDSGVRTLNKGIDLKTVKEGEQMVVLARMQTTKANTTDVKTALTKYADWGASTARSLVRLNGTDSIIMTGAKGAGTDLVPVEGTQVELNQWYDTAAVFTFHKNGRENPTADIEFYADGKNTGTGIKNASLTTGSGALADQLALFVQNGSGAYDDVEVYRVMADENGLTPMTLLEKPLTSESGEAITGVYEGESFVIRFNNPIIESSAEGKVKVNGQSVNIRLTADRRGIVVPAPADGWTGTGLTVSVAAGIKGYAAEDLKDGAEWNLTLKHPAGSSTLNAEVKSVSVEGGSAAATVCLRNPTNGAKNVMVLMTENETGSLRAAKVNRVSLAPKEIAIERISLSDLNGGEVRVFVWEADSLAPAQMEAYILSRK